MKHNTGVRWLKNDEFELLTRLDQAIFKHSWHQETMNEVVNSRCNLCVIAEGPDGLPVGFLIFEVKADRFYILKMGVLEEHRRSGFGDRLVWFLADRLGKKRDKIEIDVRETLALETHAFYSSFGFTATGVRSEFFKSYNEMSDDPFHVEDSYNFVFTSMFELPSVPEIVQEQEILCNSNGDADREFL